MLLLNPKLLPNVISSIALIIFLIGRFQVKKNLKLHIKLMSLAMTIDILLVIALVLMRNALGTVVSGKMSGILMVHVPIAISTVIAYGFATYFGLKLKRGQRQYLKHMRITDKVVIPLRLLNTFTSWLLFIYA
ncbi:MAG: hypothetical protein KDD40_00980 [Bdellovibrionales bacterium]|nr:hypothetical protein [Bdellovibrionales bacterium]